MVTVGVFEFCVMRCQPLRRALAYRGSNGTFIIIGINSVFC
ncbi:iron transporter [Vibrio paracholerae]|uniref:Iron transporter n=1 Tax=Vibrio paracholerae TaxID=650003 RepID=A0ABX9FCW4_9VIBR|nr:iron transporter [Vibrio paracholerae]